MRDVDAVDEAYPVDGVRGPGYRGDHGGMDKGRALAVAHRGDPYRHRENTLPSLCSAVLAGADVVEIDVRTTRDGVPVLLHDLTLKRLWDLDRPVAGMDARAVRELGVPTLGEALDVLVNGAAPAPAGAGACRVLVDLTERDGVRAVVGEVRERGPRERVYYCGGATCMLAVRRQDPGAEIALTWKRALPPPASLLEELRPRWLNIPFGIAGPELVARARKDGLLVGVWTVDLRRNMARMLRSGVDAVTTNRIGLLRRVADRERERERGTGQERGSGQ